MDACSILMYNIFFISTWWERILTLDKVEISMITLVGVGHVMDIAVQIDIVITQRMPDAVCIELDRARYKALRSKVHGGKKKLQ